MIQYLFPYNAIPKGSRVVVYGGGAVGNDYIRQLELSAYCCVVLWIDRVFDDENIFAPETLMRMEPEAYDIIVLATIKECFIKEMKAYLESIGIYEQHISGAAPIDCCQFTHTEASHTEITVSRFIKELNTDGAELVILRDYMQNSYGHLEYFGTLIADINNSNLKLKELLIDTVYSFISGSDCGVEIKIVVLYIMRQSKCLNADMLRMLMELACSCSLNWQQKLVIYCDIGFMYLTDNKLIFREMFLMAKNLIEKTARECACVLNIPQKHRAPCSDRNKKLVITQIMWPGKDYQAPLKLTSQLANKLCGMGFDITVIDLGAFEYDRAALFIYLLYNAPIAETQKTFIRSFFNDRIEVYFTKGAVLSERLQVIVDKIYEISPDCILDVSCEWSMLPFFLKKDFPVMYWPMRGPSSCGLFHKIAMMPEYYIYRSDFVAHPFKITECVDIPIFYETVKPQKTYIRSEYGLEANDFVLISVGGRLNYEMQETFVESICSILTEHTGIKWIVCGVDTIDIINQRYHELIGTKIFYVMYEKDLPALYRLCDVYLNPNRLGGGVSIAWACQQGLALATPKGLTSGYVFAGDEFSVNAEEDLAPYIVELIKNPDLLIRNKQHMKAKADTLNIDLAAERFKTEIEKLITEYKCLEHTNIL